MKEIEQEAIAFFRKQMTKREEDWLQIVSVAGHASQSSADIRKFVGPQNEFKSFLVKYPHIFVVRDEYCGLKGKSNEIINVKNKIFSSKILIFKFIRLKQKNKTKNILSKI